MDRRPKAAGGVEWVTLPCGYKSCAGRDVEHGTGAAPPRFSGQEY
jgi:hypothetical protein